MLIYLSGNSIGTDDDDDDDDGRRTTDDRRHTSLASRGLEEPFFQSFCCVVLVCGSCGNKVFDLLFVCWVCGSGNYDRKKKIQSSV